MAFLVLASPSDQTAIRVAALLKRRHGCDQIQLRTPAEITLAPHWKHRVADAGTRTCIELHDGTELSGPVVVFNRLQHLDTVPQRFGSVEDRDYAQAELSALVLSWLSGAGRAVINRPSALGLAGGIRRPLVWQRLAQRAGLSTVPLHVTTSTRRFPIPSGFEFRAELTWQDPYFHARSPRNQFCWSSDTATETVAVCVVGGHAFGNVPRTVLDGCLRLAELTDLDLLQLDFARSERAAQGFAFLAANSCPHVIADDVIAAIANHLDQVAVRLQQETCS